MDLPNKQIVSAVGERLRSLHQDWDDAPEQGVFDRARILGRVDRIQAALADVAGTTDYLHSDGAAEQTRVFVHNAFDVYEGKKQTEEHPWVFAVPGRIEDRQDGKYASEVTPFLPILSPDFGVDDVTRQLTTMSLAPSVIETYRAKTFGEEKGAILWTPFFVDGTKRVDGESWREFVHRNTPGIRKSVSETARFAAERLGAKVMGLGATIPSFTQMGKTIHQEGLVTTTGHAGTVYLLQETVGEVSRRMSLEGGTVGLLGAGAIGSAWAELAMKSGTARRISMYDRDDQQMLKLSRKIDRTTTVDVRFNELEVFESTDIIVSAINRTLDLDYLEWFYKKKIDLTGKVIIDDSQPGAFTTEQVEARGGTLVWVVGQDTSISKTLHREGGYNFGEAAGLYGDGSVWGCEAEAGAIYLQDRKDLAVQSHVHPDMVVAIGALCREIGITVANPLQSFGRPVDVDTGFSLGVSGL